MAPWQQDAYKSEKSEVHYLMKTILKVLLNSNNSIHIMKTINYLLNNKIQYPGNYHAIVANLGAIEKVVCI